MAYITSLYAIGIAVSVELNKDHDVLTHGPCNTSAVFRAIGKHALPSEPMSHGRLARR